MQISVNGTFVASVVDTAPSPTATWSACVVASSSGSSDAPPTGIQFSAFSITDLATPVTLGTNPVVYADSMVNPDTGWETQQFASDLGVAYGSGGYNVTANGWVYSTSVYTGSELDSSRFAVTAKVISGAVETYSSVYCGPATGGDPQYIFFASPNGSWAIDSLPNTQRAPIDLVAGHVKPARRGRTVTVAGSCTPVSSGGGHYTTLLVIFVNGRQVGSTKAVATGTRHAWTNGIMIVTFQGDPTATVSFTNYSIVQLQP